MTEATPYQWTVMVFTKKPNGKDEAYNRLRFHDRESALDAIRRIETESSSGGEAIVSVDSNDGERLSFRARDFLRAKLEKYSLGLA